MNIRNNDAVSITTVLYLADGPSTAPKLSNRDIPTRAIPTQVSKFKSTNMYTHMHTQEVNVTQISLSHDEVEFILSNRQLGDPERRLFEAWIYTFLYTCLYTSL